MTNIPAGTRFDAIRVNAQYLNKRSGLINSQDPTYSIEDIISTVGGNTNSISTNGFRLIGPINSNIILPDNSILEYTGPLIMGLGYSITVPLGTTLTIV